MIDLKHKIQTLEAQIDVLNSSLNDSQYLSNIGSWNWDVITNQVTWSDNMFRILGLEPNEQEPSYELALHHVHESDKERYEDVLTSAINNKTSYFLENKITKKDNSVISVISRGNCVFDVDVNLIQMFGTVQDITEQKQLEKILNEKVKFEEADKVRSMFLSIISHELKHPYVILKIYSQLFIESIQKGEYKKAEEFAEIIKDISNQTFNAINDLLEWTRINSNELTYFPEKINFKKFINKIISPFSIISKNKNISINVSENSIIELYADKNVLRILFKHLIENALKFSHKKGHIIVSATPKNNEIEFSVADNGVGIELECQQGLFNLDNMHRTSGTDGELGTGIGLKLCKTLIEKHGGTFWIDSEVDKGTTCVFTLPNP